MTDTKKEPSDLGKMSEMEEERFRRRLLAIEKETENLRARARILGIGLLVTLILGAVGAFSSGIFSGSDEAMEVGVLTVQRVVLVDGQGVARGEWRVDDEGNARLGLLDRLERTRLSFSVLSGGSPGMSLVNSNGRRRAGLALLPDESTSLVFADGAGIPRAVLGLSVGDAAQLVFADAGGTTRMALGLDETGVGNMTLPEEMAEQSDTTLGVPAGGSR
jgi:hypothetical protein